MLNFDLEPECVNGELRAALQWIAASELGVPALYFRKTPEHNLAKVRADGGRAQRFVRITALSKKKISAELELQSFIKYYSLTMFN